jgi:hypothetical protein
MTKKEAKSQLRDIKKQLDAINKQASLINYDGVYVGDDRFGGWTPHIIRHIEETLEDIKAALRG